MRTFILLAVVASGGCAGLTERPTHLVDHDGDPSTPAIVVEDPSVLDEAAGAAAESFDADAAIRDAVDGDWEGVGLAAGGAALTGILAGFALWARRRRSRGSR